MALTEAGIVTISVPMVDETGSESTFSLNFELTLATLPTLIAGVVALIPLAEALSGASARGLSITVPYRETDAPNPDPDSRVERTARFDMLTVNGRSCYVSIPAVDPTLVDENGYIAVTGASVNPAVAAFVAALTALPVSDSRGEQIASVVEAREIMRASGRRGPAKRR